MAEKNPHSGNDWNTSDKISKSLIEGQFFLNKFSASLNKDAHVEDAHIAKDAPDISSKSDSVSGSGKLKTTIFSDIFIALAKTGYLSEEEEDNFFETDLSETLTETWKNMIEGVNSRGFKSTGLGANEVSWIFDEVQSIYEDDEPDLYSGMYKLFNRINKVFDATLNHDEPFALFTHAVALTVFGILDFALRIDKGPVAFKQSISWLKRSENFEESKLTLDLLDILEVIELNDFVDIITMSLEVASEHFDLDFVDKNHEKLIKCLSCLAQQGFADAQLVLGIVYFVFADKIILDVDAAVLDGYRAEGVKTLKLAANNGFDLAQFALGLHYERAMPGEKDEAEATRWYLKAANNGLKAAQRKVAERYEQGNGVKADAIAAMRWRGAEERNANPESEEYTNMIEDQF
ncbi:MAG: sel1 repeat family protein [Clostridiales bacterium]|nr:sel1 repeat family protein [Clostridiales bacterium]